MRLKILLITTILVFVHWTVSFADIEQIQKLTANGNLDEALIQTNKELENDKSNVTYRFLKGLILTRLEKLEEARDVFIDITNSNPELPEPYNNLAVIYASLGDYEKARELLEQAINTHPAYATAHENIGDIYAKLASQAYNQALELDRDNKIARAKLSLVNDLFSVPETVEAVVVADSRPQTQNVIPEKVPVEQPVAAIVQKTTPPITVSQQRSETAQDPVPEPVSVARQEPVRQQQPVAVVQQEPVRQQQQVNENNERQISVSLVKQTVLDWAAAWSRKDAEGYLAYYAGDFSPADGRTLGQWRQLRLQRIAAPRSIRVQVSDLVVEMLGSDHAQATFTQVYNSPGYSDRVKKNLLFKQEQNSWRITQEQTK